VTPHNRAWSSLTNDERRDLPDGTRLRGRTGLGGEKVNGEWRSIVRGNKWTPFPTARVILPEFVPPVPLRRVRLPDALTLCPDDADALERAREGRDALLQEVLRAHKALDLLGVARTFGDRAATLEERVRIVANWIESTRALVAK
jgi:hypothetical protein